MTTFYQRFSVRLFLIVPAILAISIFSNGCASGKKTMISRTELADQIRSGSPPAIVDVRSSDEYEAGHIPGAIHIPYWAVFTRSSKIHSGDEEPLVLYCEHGPRAKMAKLGFMIVGFREILYLEGHMSSWREANLQIEKSASP